MFILKKGHQPGVYVPLRALFLVDQRAHDCYGLVYFSHLPVKPRQLETAHDKTNKIKTEISIGMQTVQ